MVGTLMMMSNPMLGSRHLGNHHNVHDPGDPNPRYNQDHLQPQITMAKIPSAFYPPIPTCLYCQQRCFHENLYRLYHFDHGHGCCGGCVNCMTRIPYATLIATVLCCAGVGIFLGSMYRGVALSIRLFEDVFKYPVHGLSDLKVVFIVIGGVMGTLSLLLLLVGFLSTGATRESVYRDWKARLGGRISCGIFIFLTYLLELVWILVLICLVAITLIYSLWWGLCRHRDNHQNCIDLQQLDFLFPETYNGQKINLNICDGNLKDFCKDYVDPAGVMFIVALAASVLVIISLIHYLMCLSANYAHIKDHKKFQDLQELQYLQETEMGTLPKERY